MDPIQAFDVLRFEDSRSGTAPDLVATEAPLEVRLEGQPFSVIMRTPGADSDLAAGFLFTEGVVTEAGQIQRIDVGPSPNVINVSLASSRATIVPALLGQRRQVVMNSSCGMCGRRTLESLNVNRPPLAVGWSVSADIIGSLPATLIASQPAFADTGGLHAAGLFNRMGELELSAEDVGRHNAVDKLIGRMLLSNRLPLEQSILFVSGRSSFEIVQKAFLAGLPVVGAVSAPSSLAIELARTSGMTLLGFVRDGRFNSYTHHERVQQVAPLQQMTSILREGHHA
jgi:FdhD protein